MHREVKLDTTAAGAGIMTDLDNYPVPVQLNKDNFDFSQARPDGADIRFTTADGTPCRTRSSCGTRPTRRPRSG